MTQAEMLSLYVDAKEHVEFIPPFEDVRKRCKWRVTKYLPQGVSLDDKPSPKIMRSFQETKERWLHRRGFWFYSSKAEVAKILAGYGLTVEQFITAALIFCWVDFEERCGNTEHAYLKKRFPYAFTHCNDTELAYLKKHFPDAFEII